MFDKIALAAKDGNPDAVIALLPKNNAELTHMLHSSSTRGGLSPVRARARAPRRPYPLPARLCGAPGALAGARSALAALPSRRRLHETHRRLHA